MKDFLPYFPVSSKNCLEIVNFSDIIQEMVLKGYLPWLIWGTYNPVPKISENKMGKRPERTWPRKTPRSNVL